MTAIRKDCGSPPFFYDNRAKAGGMAFDAACTL
jgi:hypothetical protein